MKKLLLLVFLSATTTFGYYSHESCFVTYGPFASDNYDGTCSCMSGYGFKTDILGNKSCVSMSTICQDKLGWGSTYDSLSNKCTCSSSYILGYDSSGDVACISANDYCSEKYGYNSYYDSYEKSCICRSGYVLLKDTSGGLQCTSCTSAFGTHSEFDYYKKTCVCEEGYTFDEDTNQCEEKNVSAYFLLQEYDKRNRKAIVYSSYAGNRYLLDFSYGSFMSLGLYKEDDFIGQNVVINMGKDSTVSMGDKLIFNNETIRTDVVFYISAVKIVDNSFTLKTCQDIFGEHAIETLDHKCKCVTGYTWNASGDTCIRMTSITTNIDNNLEPYIKAASDLAERHIITHRDNPSDYQVSSLLLRQEIIGIALKIKGITLPDDYECTNIFKDVTSLKPNNWVCRAAEYAVKNNIVTKNRLFNPLVNVSKVESLAMIFSAFELPFQTFSNPDDVFYPNTQDWQKAVLSYAKHLGVMNTTFIDPNRPVFRGEVFLNVGATYDALGE